MNLLLNYKSLKKYMERRTLLKLGRLHIRLHFIESDDATPFLHSHPFSYMSWILRGGYSEQTDKAVLTHRRWSLIVRGSRVPHRIYYVHPKTVTLFFAWARKDNHWGFVKPATVAGPAPAWVALESGVYVRELYGRLRFCKFDSHWHVACDSPEQAKAATRPSIDQTTRGEWHLALTDIHPT